MGINTRNHTTNGYTPAELTFESQAMHYFRSPQDMRLTQHDDLDDFQAALDTIRDAAKENMKRAERMVSTIYGLNKYAQSQSYSNWYSPASKLSMSL